MYGCGEIIMNDAIQFHSRVGDDGVLNVQVNLGSQDARRDVVVTIEPLSAQASERLVATEAWPDFVAQTYGSCAGLGLERHEQANFEQREPIA